MRQHRLALAPCLALASRPRCATSTSVTCAAERQRRIERGRRILEHHADAPAADRCRSPSAGWSRRSVSPRRMRPPRFARIGRQVAHDRPGERRLARAGFAHQAQHLARPRSRGRSSLQHAPACRLRRRSRACSPRIVQAPGSSLVRGLSASRSPSPSRLKPIATSGDGKAAATRSSTATEMHESARFRHHQPPFRRRRLGAEAEEATAWRTA